jgi:hypothetical protein
MSSVGIPDNADRHSHGDIRFVSFTNEDVISNVNVAESTKMSFVNVTSDWPHEACLRTSESGFVDDTFFVDVPSFLSGDRSVLGTILPYKEI